MITLILFILALPGCLSFIALIYSFFSKDMKANQQWHRLQILIAYDQLINACLKGWADESISSRAYRKALNDPDFMLQKFIDRLFFLSPNHCQHAYEEELNRRQLPPELRGD